MGRSVTSPSRTMRSGSPDAPLARGVCGAGGERRGSHCIDAFLCRGGGKAHAPADQHGLRRACGLARGEGGVQAFLRGETGSQMQHGAAQAFIGIAVRLKAGGQLFNIRKEALQPRFNGFLRFCGKLGEGCTGPDVYQSTAVPCGSMSGSASRRAWASPRWVRSSPLSWAWQA